MFRKSIYVLICWLVCLSTMQPLRLLAQSGVNVLTYHNDNARTGQNLQETILNHQNVNVRSFGKLFTHASRGSIFAQPLYMSQVEIPNKGTHNIILVVTNLSYVSCFDADDNTGVNATALWQRQLVPSGAVASGPGILGTPVIDPMTMTVYIVAEATENSTVVVRLYALDVRTGADRLPAVPIEASVVGKGEGGNGNIVPFDAKQHQQRPALLLLNGILYIAWASRGDRIPYHGWVMGYDAATLQLRAIFNTSPNATTETGKPPVGAAIWMGGAGPAADAEGYVFLSTGNGLFNADKGGTEYGDSVLKLGWGNNSLNVIDYFTPFNQETLSRTDVDLGGGGVLLLPEMPGNRPHLLVTAGKEGRIYLIDRDTGQMGKFNASKDNVVQSLVGQIGYVWGMPAYCSTTNAIYYGSTGDALKAFPLALGEDQTTRLSLTATSQSSTIYGYPGPVPSVSANATAPNPKETAIVWTLENTSLRRTVLHAYDANDLSRELYHSQLYPERDAVDGYYNSFIVPTIANGKAYVVSSNFVSVYGLSEWVDMPRILPGSGSYYPSVIVTLACDTPSAEIRYTLNGQEPTPTSPLYTTPFEVKACVSIRARAFKSGLRPSPIAQAGIHIDQGPGDGDGLLGTYYDNRDLTNPLLTRVDPIIDFSWATPPVPNMNPKDWSVRWTGKIQPRCTGAYTFYTAADDGMRVWVDGKLLIDAWYSHGSNEFTGKINLTSGQLYDIVVDYFQTSGPSLMRLAWSSVGQEKEIIPQTQLYSGRTPTAGKPRFFPESGTFAPQLPVTLITSTLNAQIRYTTDGTDPTETSPLSTGPLNVQATTTLRARTFKNGYNPSEVASEHYTFNPNILQPNYQLNAGGPTYLPYHEDTLFIGGGGHTRVGFVDTSLITHPAPPLVYQAERIDQFGGGFVYYLSGLVPGGKYILRLHFAEIYDAEEVGQRVFDVFLNGEAILTNFDILAVAQTKYKGFVREFAATANEVGILTLAVQSVVGYGKINALEVFLAPISLSGVVALEGCVQPQQPVTFQLHSKQGGATLNFTQTLGPGGSFLLPDLLGGQYDLAVKGAKWLRRVVPVDLRGGSRSGLSLLLLGGDGNNDNSVDIFDLATLAEAFNTVKGEPLYNEGGDLNCDESVDIFDLALLAQNFNTEGDR